MTKIHAAGIVVLFQGIDLQSEAKSAEPYGRRERLASAVMALEKVPSLFGAPKTTDFKPFSSLAVQD